MKIDLYRRAVCFFSNIAFPIFCPLCGKQVRDGNMLCRTCMENLLDRAKGRKLFVSEPDWCGKCGRRLVSADAFCPECRESDDFMFLDKVCALYPYSPENKDLLTGWKINGERIFSHSFAEILASVLYENSVVCRYRDKPVRDKAPRLKTAVVPVPPRPGKIRKKGWDQIDEVCTLLKRQWHIPVSDCLVRTTKIQQKQLGKAARKMNLKGHIFVKNGYTPPDVCILIDDIITTGATLENCAEALKSKGASFVAGLTLFYD